MKIFKLLTATLCSFWVSACLSAPEEQKTFKELVKTDHHAIFIDSNSVVVAEIDDTTRFISATFKLFNRSPVSIDNKQAHIFEMTVATDCINPQVIIFNSSVFDKSNALITDFPNSEKHKVENGGENDLSLISVSYKTLCYLSKRLKAPVQI